EGLGGTYFFRDESGAKVAIMKPVDEEPLAPNNPKGFVGRALGGPGLKPSVRVGEAAGREVAAYLLDHAGFARVPPTLMVEISHAAFHQAGEREDGPPPRKLGSLQEFVAHDGDASELGSSRFRAADVHRIAILDVRLFNTDRHAGNILVRRLPAPASGPAAAQAVLDRAGEYELVPIDHGFALPEALEPPYFEWQHWSAAQLPLGAVERAYVENLDPDADVALLRRELPGLREPSLRLLWTTTTLLKACVAAGLCLAEVAAVCTRSSVGVDEEASPLEELCLAARREAEDDLEDDLDDLEEGEEDEEVFLTEE
ncbi:phosphatidylinositol 3- and 4-kinase, partial [Helicosporidium sp. ATCC 50920]